MAQSDRDELAETVAKLKEIGDIAPEVRRYVDGVVAEAERDLSSTAMGPRRGRSIFELHGVAPRVYPELLDNDRLHAALEAINRINDRLPDYFPWRFVPQPVGEETRRWSAGSWSLRLFEQPLEDEPFAPFLAPFLDRLSPHGWWMVGDKGRLTPVSPGDREVSALLNPLNPGFNEEIHLLALSGRPKAGLGQALKVMIDRAWSQAPDLTAAEAVLREIWRSPSRDLAAHFEEGRFFVAASTGRAEGLLWVTEALDG